ncbi:hypothetical protein B488_06030 [Liberibacter crescens BT-1]|uniref:Uncharacterized protein n=1 Tax=Liberibacter crescens (strain BT-1) TaxID=1215343 RepID=L0EUT4_LIBCB|nr:hypothetical protein B488_06030 [Liberibacter crescens BT-1]
MLNTFLTPCLIIILELFLSCKKPFDQIFLEQQEELGGD